MSEKEKSYELFIMDEQNYEFDSVKIVKKLKAMTMDLDIDHLKLSDEDEKAFLRKATLAQQQGKPLTEAEKALIQKHNVAGGKKEDEMENPNERSVEVLTDSDEEIDQQIKSGASKKKEAEVKVNHNTKGEKPVEVFKNLFSEFKDLIPSKGKGNEKETDNGGKKKPGMFEKAKGFFGL